jgi:DNA-directed RNA polymerase specialized sigma24 family protein
VQDTLVRAWRAIDRFERGTNLNAWLFTILRNLFHSEYRSMREIPHPECHQRRGNRRERVMGRGRSVERASRAARSAGDPGRRCARQR